MGVVSDTIVLCLKSYFRQVTLSISSACTCTLFTDWTVNVAVKTLFLSVKGTVSRVAHARLSASRSTHAVIFRHYRYGFVGNLKYTWAILRNFWIRNRKIECFSVKESQSEGCQCKRSCSTRRKSTSDRGCLCQRPTVKCTVETFVNMAEKTSRARTG